MKNKQIKLCKDCKWSKEPELKCWELECNSPKNFKTLPKDLITGEVKKEIRWKYCSTHRTTYWWEIYIIGYVCCGRKGRWFEPKE